ncbi:MAG TPA: hypothetical protein VFS47_08490 [Steroidobacteraceae bacterium]|nr:hypothetical protein [Steroidobacteraceae bacterium]
MKLLFESIQFLYAMKRCAARFEHDLYLEFGTEHDEGRLNERESTSLRSFRIQFTSH